MFMKTITWMLFSLLLKPNSRLNKKLPNKKPIYKTHSGEWMLNIRNVKHSDAGNYECQVNSDKKEKLLIKIVVS